MGLLTHSEARLTDADLAALANGLAATFGDEGGGEEEEGDEDLHVAYREALQGFKGWGDGTVPLLSSTLGRGVTTEGTRVGVLDLSGVDESPWIEEFEYFPCLHVPIVSAAD